MQKMGWFRKLRSLKVIQYSSRIPISIP